MNKRIITVTLNPCLDKSIEINGFEYGGLNRVTSENLSVGGKGINCAAVLNSIGCPVLACGITAGDMAQKYLDSIGIPYGFIVSKGKLRTNYKIINTDDNITTEINEPGFAVSGSDVQKFMSLFDLAADDACAVIISGSTPTGIDNDIYFRLTKMAQDKNVPVILDADGKKMAEGIKANPYCVKPNLYEMEQLFEQTLDTEDKKTDAVKTLIKNGIKLVILSLGGKGAIVGDEEQILRVYAPDVKCISTVGAGDSMAAAAAYCIAHGADLHTVAKTAVCAGSLTVQTIGLCNGLEALRQYTEIKTEKIV